MTLREAIEQGVVSPDDTVEWGWWDRNNEPCIDEPWEYARDGLMRLGDAFVCAEYLAIRPPRRYRVVAVPDDEDGEGEYRVERVVEDDQ